MELQDVLYGITITNLIGKTNREVGVLTFDSRQVANDAVFFAIKGTVSDGHVYINSVLEKGVSVIVCEQIPQEIVEGVTYIQVADSSVALGKMAANFYGNPSSDLQLVGITGTNGKTTIATLLLNCLGSLVIR